jgi:hypothetical protein
MANYNGFASLNGLQTTTIFTAPAAGVFFLNGQLSLPQLTTDGGVGASAVVATVKQNSSTIYTGIAGASGFQINQIVCAVGDVIAVQLSSSAAVDTANNNAVRGQVAWGNTF